MKRVPFILLMIFIVSCKDGNFKSEVEYETFDRDGLNLAVIPDEKEAAFYNPPKPKDQSLTVVNNKESIEIKLIKNGQFVFKVDSISKTKNFIAKLVKQHKGYVSSERTAKNYKLNQYMTLRIPTQNFDLFVRGLSKGVKVYDSKEINVTDVTEQFYDLTSRIENKKKLEKRYLQILFKAKNVKEILEVEREIGKLREDIESAEGKLKYLSNQVSFSTLNLSFYEVIKEETKAENRFYKAFNKGIEGIKNFCLFLISIWPFVILGIISFILLKRKFRKKKS